MGIRTCVAVCALVLAGCGTTPEDAIVEATVPPEGQPRDTSTQSPESEVARPTPTVAVRDPVLVGDGLGPVAFGTDRQAAISEAASIFGEPVYVGPGQFCPEYETEAAYDGVTMIFVDDVFTYWITEEASSLSTPEGIRVGSPRQAVVAAYGDVLEPSDMAPDTEVFEVSTGPAAGVFGTVDMEVQSLEAGQPGCGE